MLFNSRLLIVMGFVFLFLPLVQGLVVEADRDLVPLFVNEKYNGVDQISDVLEEKRYSRDLRRDILERDNL